MKTLLKKQRALLSLIIAISVLFAGTSVASAVLLEKILDAVTSQNWQLFRTTAILVPVYVVTAAAVIMLNEILVKKLIVRIIRQLRDEVYGGILQREPEGFRSANTAEYISALTNDIKIIEDNALVPFMQSIQYFLIFIGTVAALLYYNPLIAILMFGCLIVMYLVPAAFGKLIARRQEKLSGRLAEFTAGLKDQLSGFEVIHSFNLTRRMLKQFKIKNEEVTVAKYDVDRMIMISTGLAQALAAGTQLLVVLVSGWLVLRGHMTAGVLLAILQLSGTFVHPVGIIMENLSMIQSTKPIFEQFEKLKKQTIDPVFNGEEMPAFDTAVVFEDVSFAYNPDCPVLEQINLQFKKNKKYAIIGTSGCGKSTLIRLMGAEYGAYEGNITVDGKELREVKLDEWLEHFSAIHQDVYMFDESISENIDLHYQYDEDVWNHALAVSGVRKFLDQIPGGIDAPAGENGSNLSGGQRQRVAVARALIRSKPILVLDEGTSALDMQTAYDIESALLDTPDITIINITHNLNPQTLRRYDEILFMNEGRIAAVGDYDTLMVDNKSFAEFLQIQKEEVA